MESFWHLNLMIIAKILVKILQLCAIEYNNLVPWRFNNIELIYKNFYLSVEWTIEELSIHMEDEDEDLEERF